MGGDKNYDLRATGKWICGDKFEPRPLNISGVPRVELARKECDGEHIHVIYDPTTDVFVDAETGIEYGRCALDIRIVEIK